MRQGGLPRLLLIVLAVCAGEAAAQQEPFLRDRDGDGIVKYLAFGDSITYGVGDGVPLGEIVDEPPRTDGSGGYPARLRSLLGIPVVNAGLPGERLVEGGRARFPGVLLAQRSDIVGIEEAANDAVGLDKTPTDRYGLALQRLVNIVRALNSEPLLITTPLPCCEDAGYRPFIATFNGEMRRIAQINEVQLADIERAWRTSCTDPQQCEYFVLPDGLHPNSTGYHLMAQTIAAALLEIDAFAEGGAALLESALGLPAGSVLIRPGL